MTNLTGARFNWQSLSDKLTSDALIRTLNVRFPRISRELHRTDLGHEYVPASGGDDYQNIAKAIAKVVTRTRGGVVELPDPTYQTSQTVVVQPTSGKSVILRGSGMRASYLYGLTNGMTVLRLGTDTPDLSGTTTNQVQYCGIEDLSVNGSLLSSGTATAIQFTETQKCWLRNAIIENFTTGSSRGLYLRGSTTTGIGAAAAPHVWRNLLENVLVATSVRPLVIENGDENDFVGCNFALPPGVTAAADSLVAVEIIQGRNNRFFGLLLSGDSSDLTKRPAYVGIKFDQPTKGDVLSNQVYGLVAEGFDRPIWWGGNLVRGNVILGYNSSINATQYFDSAPQVGTANGVYAPLHNVWYTNTRGPYTDALTFADGATTPSVKGGEVFATNNSAPTSITDFTDDVSGQPITVRLDANTTIVHAAGVIRCPGGVNIVGAAHMVVPFTNIGGTWYAGTPTTDA